ncbi:hypothetical protein KP509_14G001900 [Ceratopteris richardii]|uniref:Uncharacterized protein n=1 Tax=Ceratopteris richardii TaxID=49495 RepID=A0A8T2T9R7_CERRI|nr:hypothetical protein KP509_14G001900 [Ceratopteris richardii]
MMHPFFDRNAETASLLSAVSRGFQISNHHCWIGQRCSNIGTQSDMHTRHADRLTGSRSSRRRRIKKMGHHVRARICERCFPA